VETLKGEDTMRPLKGVVWLLFAAISYLIVAEALYSWVKLPSAGNILFTLVFVLFSVMHCAVFEGAKRTAIFSLRPHCA
jgi:putative membrane protein